MHGWTGKILCVNLTDRTTSTLELPADVYASYIGGKGLAGYLIRDRITLDWAAPEMPLILMTGPLVGTTSPTSGRMCVMSRSPLTGTIGDTSVGGSLGTELKKAGWDGIVITGKCTDLCGIEIRDRTCTITSARNLRGAETGPLHTRLKAQGATLLIGPAAENGVRFANIMIDGHFAAGRNGLGLVCAAKNLKYLTVKGTGTVPVHDPAGLEKAREDIFRLIAASPVLMGELGIAQFGTGALYDLMDNRRMMPTDNFRKTHFESAPAMNAYAYKQRYDPKRAGCKGCHIQCKHVAQDGRAIPEFETMSHFSALIENHDIDTVIRANALCNELGMDTISAAATIACHAEVTGQRVTPQRLLTLIAGIGRGEGEGRELLEGSARYAAAHGNPGASITVKGQELPAYDPRGAYGMALAYATSTRGACHLRAYPISHEILRKPVVTNRFTFDGKARIIKIAEDMNAVVDSLTACKFVFFSATLEEYSRAYTAVTGVPSSAQELLRIGERIYYLDRIMNALNGFTAAEDDLPARFFKEAGTGGNGIEIPALSRDDFLQARARYYRVRGLDEHGVPTKTKAEELGLKWDR